MNALSNLGRIGDLIRIEDFRHLLLSTPSPFVLNHFPCICNNFLWSNLWIQHWFLCGSVDIIFFHVQHWFLWSSVDVALGIHRICCSMHACCFWKNYSKPCFENTMFRWMFECKNSLGKVLAGNNQQWWSMN